MLPRLFLFLLVLVTQVAGEIRVTLTPPQPTLGERATLEMKIINEPGRLESLGPTAQVDGYDINWNQFSTSNSTFINNGQASHEISLSWSVQPTSLGTKIIPPIQVVLSGKTSQSQALRFEVVPAQTSSFYLLQSSLDRDRVAMGGVAILTLDLCLADQEIRQFENIIGGEYELAQNHYDDLALPQALQDQFHVQVLEGRPSNRGTWFGAPTESRSINGFPYRIHRIKLELEPKKPGRMEIPAFGISFYRLGNFQRNFFGKVNASKVGPPLRAEAPALYLNVLPPPVEGQPPHFQGQVCGELTLGVKIDDFSPGDKVQLHAPLSLTLTLSSDRRGASLQFPDFKNQPSWKDTFDINTSAMVREDHENSVVFQGIIVRPKDKNLKAIPPVEVPYFSTKLESYQIARSEAIPFILEAMDDATVLNEKAVEVLMVEKERHQQTTVSRLHGLETDLERLKSVPSPSLSWTWVGPLVGALWIMGFILSVVLPLWRERSRKSQADFQASWVLGALDEASSPTQILDLFSKYLLHQHRCHDPDTFTHRDAVLQSDLKTLVRALAHTGYGRVSEGGNLLRDTKAMIQRLESVR